MAVFSKVVITDMATEYMNKPLVSSELIKFTKIGTSTKEYNFDDLHSLTELENIEQLVDVSGVQISDQKTILVDGILQNFKLKAGYYLRSFGLYAEFPNVGEILYAVAVETSGECYIPAYNHKTVSDIYFHVSISVKNADSVSLEVNPSATVTIKQFNKHVNDHGNPHQVTKLQIGLGNVDNTADINKPVSNPVQSALDLYYTQLTSYTDKSVNDLVNGAPTTLDTLKELADAITENKSIQEALDAAIGTKADKAEFESHTKNKNNPHGVTKTQVGLGNVPNVSTNDQTPTFVQAITRSNLVSGEKISVSLGKVMKWFADLKTGAFSIVVNNDTTTAEGYVADARIIKVHGDEIDALKKSVSDGKKTVAAAITAQGVNTAADAEFSTMATNIKTVGTNKYNAGVSATKKGTATAGQVLTGYTFTNSSGVGLSGSMPNRGALNWNPGGATSYAVPAGYYSGGTISSSAAYSQGVTDADNRPNGNSVNYVSGYNAGVAAADNRANPGSVNYQTGYNNGYGAGAASKPTIYTGSTNVWVSKGHEYPVIQHPAANSFAISNAVSNDDYNNLWVRIRSNTTTAATLHCSGQGNSEGTVTINWIAW